MGGNLPAAAICGLDLPRSGFASRLPRRDSAAGARFLFGDPVRIGQRAAGAQAGLDRFGHRLARRAKLARAQSLAQHRAPVAHVLAQRADVGQRIAGRVAAGQMARRARPGPVLGRSDHSGRDRVVLDIAHRRHQVRVVHRIAGKARLEQVPAPALAKVDMAGIAPVRLAQRGTQAIAAFGQQDQVDVVVHQAPGQASHLRPGAAIAQQRKVKRAVLVAEEHRQAPVAALGDVMRHAGKDYARKPGHGGRLGIGEVGVK